MTSATGRARREGGFTLMELLVVIVILVLLASAFPVALDRALPGRRVVSTTQKLLSAIRDAQSLAAASGRAVQLTLDTSGLSGDRVSVRFPATTHVKLQDAEGLSLNTLWAYPEGTLTESRIVVGERAHQRTLHLSGLTGRITLEVSGRAR